MARTPAKTYDDFLNGSDGVMAVQQQLLTETMYRNALCNYGQLHGFGSVTDHTTYAKLPYMTYDKVVGVEDYWSEPENYTTDPVSAFFLTSGSSAMPKRIPVTSSLIRQKAAAFSVFWDSIYTGHPTLRTGRFVANFGDSGHSQRNAQNKPELSETTFWNQRMQGFQKSDKWPIPRQLTAIQSAELRYFAAARLALQGELHCLMSLNPSTLVKFCEVLSGSAGPLAKGLSDGTWGHVELNELDLPDALTGRLAGNKAAANRLARAMAGDSTPFSLRNIWPELELIICWQSELVSPYLSLLQRHTTGIAFRDYITQSSECIIAIPVSDNRSGGLLAYHSHYYEFIPEAEAAGETPDSLPAWALTAGNNYEVVVTTGGGLYRYRTGDCVHVDEMVGDLPLLSFQYRLGRTSSITGEKLTEQQVLQALSKAGTDALLTHTDVLVYPRTAAKPHYVVLFAAEHLKPGKDDNDIANWITRFHHALCEANGEYRDKCASLRLGTPSAMMTAFGNIAAIRQRRRAAHVGDEQFKPGILQRERDLESGLEIHGEIHARS